MNLQSELADWMGYKASNETLRRVNNRTEVERPATAKRSTREGRLRRDAIMPLTGLLPGYVLDVLEPLGFYTDAGGGKRLDVEGGSGTATMLVEPLANGMRLTLYRNGRKVHQGHLGYVQTRRNGLSKTKVQALQTALRKLAKETATMVSDNLNPPTISGTKKMSSNTLSGWMGLAKKKPAAVGKIYKRVARGEGVFPCNDGMATDSGNPGACSHHQGLKLKRSNPKGAAKARVAPAATPAATKRKPLSKAAFKQRMAEGRERAARERQRQERVSVMKSGGTVQAKPKPEPKAKTATKGAVSKGVRYGGSQLPRSEAKQAVRKILPRGGVAKAAKQNQDWYEKRGGINGTGRPTFTPKVTAKTIYAILQGGNYPVRVRDRVPYVVYFEIGGSYGVQYLPAGRRKGWEQQPDGSWAYVLKRLYGPTKGEGKRPPTHVLYSIDATGTIREHRLAMATQREAIAALKALPWVYKVSTDRTKLAAMLKPKRKG